jgi:hypothetical protein
MIGGLSPYRNNRLQASSINSVTGSTQAPDISAQDTLTAFLSTVMTAAGVPEDRVSARLPDGKAVTSIFG